MMSCWKSNPDERPPFSNLVQSIEDMIQLLDKYIDFSFS